MTGCKLSKIRKKKYLLTRCCLTDLNNLEKKLTRKGRVGVQICCIDNLKKKDIIIKTKLFKCKLVLKIPFFEFSILHSILSTQFNDILRVKLQIKSLNHLKLGVLFL